MIKLNRVNNKHELEPKIRRHGPSDNLYYRVVNFCPISLTEGDLRQTLLIAYYAAGKTSQRGSARKSGNGK